MEQPICVRHVCDVACIRVCVRVTGVCVAGNGCARGGGKARPWSVAGGNADSAALCTTGTALPHYPYPTATWGVATAVSLVLGHIAVVSLGLELVYKLEFV